MSAYDNQVQLIGRCGSPPERVTLTDGSHRLRTILYQDTRGEAESAPTQRHRLVAWNGVALQMELRVRRGDRLLVQGKLVNRGREREGVQWVQTEVEVRHFALLQAGNGQSTPSAHQLTNHQGRNE